jgi:UDP-GlcNAc:undecaprenyl-phosphate GlcNAc-1-phosphate transferase
MVLSTCNATNFLDGLDGLCGGVTAIIALGFLGLATFLATWGHAPAVDELRIALCLAMVGAILGFLPYNAPPATIFMGDAGSMLLGFFVAAMMGLFCHDGPARWVLASGLIFGLPILDTALALVRRIRKRVSIFSGDRSHLYDQLVDRGLSVNRVVFLFYVISIVFAVLGVTIAIALRTRYAVVIYAALLLVIWTIFSIAGMISPGGGKKDEETAQSIMTAEPLVDDDQEPYFPEGEEE